ncbi:MAG: cytochrome [Nitrospirae bacterium]|jgi:DmsE family decaheme c-type cytochrome|nr:cytochrome [Nitrospirota bacterium]MBS1242582.1 cytochrome [Nitrospirota bacterium]
MERTLKMRKWILLGILGSFFVAAGCATLKETKPIYLNKEYEKMIAGRLDADYVGTDNCLKACHFHDTRRRDFDLSTMGAQLSRESGMPIVNCESCHGPGSLAIEGLTPEKVAKDAKAGKQTACDYRTLVDMKKIPAQAKSLICLKCHTANATFNLHNWNASTHNMSDVSCSDCHNIHMGHNLKVKPREMTDLCYKCHPDVQANFRLPNHHPVPEKKIFCTDCHDAHGGMSGRNLRKDTVKETCTQCHSEKQGPFLYEHADLTEDCRACHTPHGSVNNNLLSLREPYLCLQCHPTHPLSGSTTAQSKKNVYTRCTDCHSQIHGTDLPSPSGKGTFVR